MADLTDSEVDAFVESHPGGGTLDEIADALGVTKQRAYQLVNAAVEKALMAYKRRGVTCVGDVLHER